MKSETAMRPSLADKIKCRFLVMMRMSHQRTLEVKSGPRFRKRVVPTTSGPRLIAAARQYRGIGWLPSALLAADTIPREAMLRPGYALPYYMFGKIGWKAYGMSPINQDLPWDPKSSWNDAFPKGPIDWGDPIDDQIFTSLRLQGPNPFMLKRVVDDSSGDQAAAEFELDFSQLFDGVFDPVVARFRVNEGVLEPAWISIGGRRYDRGEDGWDTAKRVVNGLDARYAAFVRHLLNSHLMVGQAYALAAYSLPVWHPLRAFMDFFTYSTMHVNQIAFTSLLTTDSYFLRSHFITPQVARGLIENAMASFDFDEWIAPRDLAKRGLGEIKGHPYAEDAMLVWPAIERVVEGHLDDLDIDDETIRTDSHLAAWYATLTEVLPNSSTVPQLTNRQSLEDLMAALIYNNVIHEICGNLNPLLGSRDHADKAAISFEGLVALTDMTAAQPIPRAADVLLMDQAAFVSGFNVSGNALLTINAPRYIDDPKLQLTVKQLQNDLTDAAKVIAQRNEARKIPFRAMEPHRWEASISF